MDSIFAQKEFMDINRFRTNIKQIDEEHHLLIVTLSLIKASSSAHDFDIITLNLLNNLKLRTKIHLRNEEQYLLRAKCSKHSCEEHISNHHELEKELDEILLDPERKELSNKLHNWLLPHLVEDKEILLHSENLQ